MLAVIGTAAALHGSLVLSDRSEVRLRDSHEATGRAWDVETLPSAALRVADRRWELDAAYAPRFTFRAINKESAGRDLLQRGIFGIAWHDRRLRIGVGEELVYGDQSFTSLSSVTPSTGLPHLELLPAPTTIQYFSTRTFLTARVAAGHRWTVTSDFEYLVRGGANDESRRVLPLQSGPRVQETVEYLATRRDRVSTALIAQRAVFTPGPESTLFELDETWRHAFTRHIAGTVSAGFAMAAERADRSGAPRWTPHPVGELTTTYELQDRLLLLAGVRIGPVIDRLTGVIDERVQLRLASTWRFLPRFSLRAEGGIAQSVPADENNAISFAAGELALGYQPIPEVRAEFGTRTAWQGLRGAEAMPSQWVVFLAFTLATPALDL